MVFLLVCIQIVARVLKVPLSISFVTCMVFRRLARRHIIPKEMAIVENPSSERGQEQKEEDLGQWIVVGVPPVPSRLPQTTGPSSAVGVAGEVSLLIGVEASDPVTPEVSEAEVDLSGLESNHRTT
ncbi:hypothetical protein AOLI_G00105170 [Acnodon oligacanthus]